MSGAGGAPYGAPPERLRPAASVHYVVIEETAILFDVRRDRYAAAPAAAFLNALAPHTQGPAPSEHLRRQFVSQGLLVPDPAGADAHASARTSWPAFSVACLWAEYYLRRRRLDLALTAIRRGRAMGESFVSEHALARFQYWRPWYPRRNVCLFDSLALAAFLIGAGERPEIVFGVRHPLFAAHCWLEAGKQVVNDEPAYCGAFVEILRV